MEALVAADDPDPLKATVSGAGPADVEEEMTAVGGAGGVMTIGAVAVMEVDAILVRPAVLVTVSLAVYTPAML